MNFNIKKFFFWKKKYIPIDEISQALLKARQDEIKKQKEIYGEQVDSIIDQMDTEKKIEVEELKAEIEQMKTEIIEMKKEVKDAREIYNKSTTKGKKFERFTKEISESVKKLHESIGIIQSVHDKTEWFMNEIEKEKKKDEKKLGLNK